MSNQSKYYTPSIEEFHVGFEYQTETMSTSGASTYFIDAVIENPQEIKDAFEVNSWYGLPRVKHLDREDIESLGWKINGSRCFTLDKYDFWLDKNGMCDIHRKGDYDREYPSVTMKIKNKSELKRLMKQLEIIES